MHVLLFCPVNDVPVVSCSVVDELISLHPSFHFDAVYAHLIKQEDLFTCVHVLHAERKDPFSFVCEPCPADLRTLSSVRTPSCLFKGCHAKTGEAVAHRTMDEDLQLDIRIVFSYLLYFIQRKFPGEYDTLGTDFLQHLHSVVRVHSKLCGCMNAEGWKISFHHPHYSEVLDDDSIYSIFPYFFQSVEQTFKLTVLYQGVYRNIYFLVALFCKSAYLPEIADAEIFSTFPC